MSRSIPARCRSSGEGRHPIERGCLLEGGIMVLVSYSGKEINAKIVFYGPGLSGKTSNLEYIYGSIPSNHRGKMVSMKTKTERTLFFDFLPLNLGELAGFKTRFLLYTVPGQVYYNATRKLVLKGVDAVVFVASKT
jgi:signal recognition particle receptor subunit beta